MEKGGRKPQDFPGTKHPELFQELAVWEAQNDHLDM